MIRSPYPYHGAKTGDGALLIWQALGNVPNFVDPSCGSLSPVLLRPYPPKVETCNDLDGFVTNFWRAIQEDPEAVAYWADRPVNELDMHAIRRWLIKHVTPEWIERMRADIDYFDAQIAGRWVWLMAIWIGGGATDPGTLRQKKRPVLNGNGRSQTPREGIGINRPRLTSGGPIPYLAGPGNPGGSGVGYGRGIFATGRGQELREYFALIHQRVRRIRFTCGDFMRVLTPAVTTDHGMTGVLLDLPYGTGSGRKIKLYREDDASVSARARVWALEHGKDPLFRIALCSYAGEHDAHMPATWRCVAWKSHSGYKNADKERIWLSPYCLGGSQDLPLFQERR